MGNNEFAFIHFLRAVAALWVLVAHVMIWGGWYWYPLGSAKLAVDLFMLVSGFLMVATSGPMDDPRQRAQFWLRRFFRIAPTYYLALLVVWVAQGPFLSGYAALQDLNPGHWPDGGPNDPSLINLDARNLFLHITFVFGLLPDYAFSTFLPDWSLSLEMQFYFFFPFLLILMRQRGPYALTLVSIAVYILTAQFAAGFAYPEPSMLGLKLHVFVAGALVYEAMRSKETQRILTIGCALFLASLESWKIAAMVAFMIGLGFLEFSADNPVAMVTKSRVVKFASDASYGVYLFHGFWIAACGLAFAGTSLPGCNRVGIMLPVVLTGSMMTGWLLHRYVERPGIKLGKWVATGRWRELKSSA